MLRDWDINLWFKEHVVDDEVVRDDFITINPAIYINEDPDGVWGAVYKIYTGLIYKCDAIETAKIRAFRTEQEYGDDWWDFRDDLYALEISQGIQDFLNDLPDPYSIDTGDNGDLYHIDSIEKLHRLVG